MPLEKWEEVLGVARATAIERISKTTTGSDGVVGRKVRKLFTKRVQQKKIKESYAGNNPAGLTTTAGTKSSTPTTTLKKWMRMISATTSTRSDPL